MSLIHSLIKFDGEGKIPPECQRLLEKEPLLVIEVPKDSFWGVKKTDLEVGYGNLKSGLKSPSIKISPFRWQHIEFFLLIQPNINQLYIAANLQMPHYHLLPEQLIDFRTSALKYGFNKNDIRVLSNKKNHHRLPHVNFDDLPMDDTNRFLTVINNFELKEMKPLKNFFLTSQ